jgi:hypothetical protein
MVKANASISYRFKQLRAENAPLLAGIAGSWRGQSLWGETMKILTGVFAAGAFGGLYIALGERDPWLSLGAAVVCAVLCHAAARHSVRSASPAIAPNERHRHPLAPGRFFTVPLPASRWSSPANRPASLAILSQSHAANAASAPAE